MAFTIGNLILHVNLNSLNNKAMTMAVRQGVSNMNIHAVAALFDEWNSALQAGDPQKLATLYEDDAILLPTMSKQVRHNTIEIRDYFYHFCAGGPVGKIDESNVRTFGQLAINSGVYTFTYADGSALQARFTFVYRWNGRRWMIVEHHSSQMPET